jgi:F0F1-type ATP synthase assembly protein I
MKSLVQKLTSRKFLLSAVSMAAGIALLCGADATTVSVLAGACMTVLPSLVYCLMEGRIDSAAVTASKEAYDTAVAAAFDSSRAIRLSSLAISYYEICEQILAFE